MKAWPTAIVVTLGLFVTVQIGLIRIATVGFEGPDDVNYYKMGLEYSRELQRQKVQRRNGWRLEVQQRAPLQCRVLDRLGQPLEGHLEVTFKRPATRSQDQKLNPTASQGLYQVPWRPASGPWLVDFQFDREGQTFRSRQRWTMP